MKNRMLPFDASKYDDLPISVFIYEPIIREDDSVWDYTVVYGNESFARLWETLLPGRDFLGRNIIEDRLLSNEALLFMDKFRREDSFPFFSYTETLDAHLFLQPITALPSPYGGFFLINVTEYEEKSSRDHFLLSIRQMENSAVLMRQNEDGTLDTIFVSEDFARMMECGIQEARKLVSGTGFFETIYLDDRLPVRRMLRHRISGNGKKELTVRVVTAKGTVLWCTIHYAFIDDFNEHYIYCTYQDVTATREYEQRLRASYISMGDNFYQTDRRTLGMFRVNLSRDKIEDIQGRDLFGTDSAIRPFSELLRLRQVNYPIPSERAHLFQIFSPEHLKKAFLDGQAQVSRYFFSRRKDGRCCFVNLTAAMTRHPLTGEIVAFITEREANGEKVQETLLDRILARQFDMVAYLVNGTYGVVLGDAENIEEGSIFPVSDTGNYAEYLENQVFPVLSGSPDQKTAMEDALSMDQIREKASGDEPYVVNIACDIDGRTWYKELNYYRVDPDAEFYVLLKSDTTAVQKMQIEQNERLREALDEARQASVAKTAFLSRMSHEIRTPMNAIIGLDTIALQEKGITDSTRDHLEKIGASARYLLTLINDILDMSRIESGRMILKNEEFSFRQFLDEVNTIVDSQCRDRGLHYDCRVSGRLEENYIGDNMKLKQVLINILGNSVKFTNPGGSVSLFVECVARYEGNASIRFIIRDTGIGMEKEFLPRIFEAFSQEDATTTSSYGGSGLGLAITKNIVEMMNGTITVDSDKGSGTEFVVTVTLKESENQVYFREFDFHPKELSVLVIDDDPVALQHAKIVLEEVGIACEQASSGAEALEKIRLRHARMEDYDLVLVDQKMPMESGVQVTKKIRETMVNNDAAIVILTAYSWADIEEEARNAGVDSFMSKPLFAAGVLQEFQHALRKKQQKELEKEAAVPLAGLRVLLAEDTPINAEIVKELLELEEITSEHAENGKAAADLFAEKPAGYYDAVLMDVRMPVMDGLEAARAIRASGKPDSLKIPIIAMTANAFDEDVQRSLQAGMNAHLSKPVEPGHLFQTLSELIGRRRREEGGI